MKAKTEYYIIGALHVTKPVSSTNLYPKSCVHFQKKECDGDEILVKCKQQNKEGRNKKSIMQQRCFLNNIIDTVEMVWPPATCKGW